VIKSRGVQWMGHVECMRGVGNAYKNLVETPEGMRSLEKPGFK